MALGISYVPSLALGTPIAENLARFMIESTNGKMSKAIFTAQVSKSSTTSLLLADIVTGSEATEAAQKLAIQYHAKEKPSPQPLRVKFIAREQSYHGATLGALELSGHDGRKTLYKPILPNNTHLIPPCNPYRNRLHGETDELYVEKRRKELVEAIIKLGADEVAALIVEPVVGAVSEIFSQRVKRQSLTI
jgi:adenosylmethionine-8-amino-7-oxononanoate aminotransferase